MKAYLTLLLCLFLCTCVRAQETLPSYRQLSDEAQVTYNAHSGRAFQALQQELPRKALKFYREAFKLDQNRPLDILRASVAATNARKQGVAKDLLDHGFNIAPAAMATLFQEQPEFRALKKEPLGDEILRRTVIAFRDNQSQGYRKLLLPGEFEVLDLQYAFNASLAQGLLQAGDYQRSLNYYAKAFDIKSTNEHSLLRAGLAAAMSGQSELAHHYFDKGFEALPGYCLTYVRLHQDFAVGLENRIFVHAVSEQISKHFPGFDLELTSEIDELWAEFSQYRQYNPNAENGFQPHRFACTADIIDPALIPQKGALVRRTYDRLDALFSKAGIPGSELVADRSILPLFMLRGASTTLLDKYWPEIMTACEAESFLLTNMIGMMAIAYDEACVREGKKQRFGSIRLFPKKLRESESIDYWPIEDPINLASRRKAASLKPLEEPIKKGGARLSVDAQLQYVGFPQNFKLLYHFVSPYSVDPRPLRFTVSSSKD